MGRVFSFEEVLQRQFPEPQDFTSARNAFNEAVQHRLGAAGIIGGALFGSVAADTATIRSDLDGILAHDGTAASYAAIGEVVEIVDEAGMSRVPIGIIAYPKEVLTTGRHEIDRFFGRQLQTGPRIVTGEDPTAYLQHDTNTPAEHIVLSYIRSKKRKMISGYCAPDAGTQDKSIQRLLELPVAVGRKLIQVMSELDPDQYGTPVDGSNKKTVVERIMPLYASLDAGSEAIILLRTDQDYTSRLEAFRSGTESAKNYLPYVRNELFSLLPRAYEWLDKLDINLQQRFDTLRADR